MKKRIILIVSILLILIQVILLKGDFEKRQYLQLVIGTIFSVFIDLTFFWWIS